MISLSGANAPLSAGGICQKMSGVQGREKDGRGGCFLARLACRGAPTEDLFGRKISTFSPSGVIYSQGRWVSPSAHFQQHPVLRNVSSKAKN
ncbi:hypothetical protein CEXT_10581 [Caerostris extrusa]|uniref:Uncharacterized protein n=1 Tax=Caerostris extrusa TaxID=172846 RepID=A0AAV4P7T4_CAEEX|nr:hypothetical protein CEXT_10581 [Caerostris extrusa]